MGVYLLLFFSIVEPPALASYHLSVAYWNKSFTCVHRLSYGLEPYCKFLKSLYVKLFFCQ